MESCQTNQCWRRRVGGVQLGYGVETVRKWVNQADVDNGERPGNVDGAILQPCSVSTPQIGSTPKSLRLASTNDTITSVGGRAPPRRADARFRISFARRSSRFSCSRRRILAFSSVVVTKAQQEQAVRLVRQVREETGERHGGCNVSLVTTRRRRGRRRPGGCVTRR